MLVPSRYAVHKFIGRKPHDLVAKIVCEETEIGDLVLDPFVGSGTTACEALIVKRRVLASDIDPFSLFLTRMLCLSPVDLEDLKMGIRAVRDEARSRILELYGLDDNCEACGRRLVCHWIIRSLGTVKTLCPECMDWQRSTVRKLSGSERADLLELERDIRIGHPLDPWTASRFTPRALLCLEHLLQAIDRHRREIRDLLRYAFSANLPKSSILNSQKKTAKGWILDDPFELNIPANPLEFNIWMGFKNRCGALLQAKAETNRLVGDSAEGSLEIQERSALELGCVNESVDHVVTDPPSNERVSYSRLHRMNRAWLGLRCPEPSGQIEPRSGLDLYSRQMGLALGQMAGALRSGGSLNLLIDGSKMGGRVKAAILKASRSVASLERLPTRRMAHRGKPYLILRYEKKGL